MAQLTKALFSSSTIETEIQTVRLDSGVVNLGKQAVMVEMCEGAAWITYDDNDVFLRNGESVELQPRRSPIVISAQDDGQRIVFNYQAIAH